MTSHASRRRRRDTTAAAPHLARREGGSAPHAVAIHRGGADAKQEVHLQHRQAGGGHSDAERARAQQRLLLRLLFSHSQRLAAV
jgi:hypothetical protein